MHLIHLFGVLPLFVAVSSTAAPPPSLAAALSFTTREQLSSHGDRVAWVEITRGVPNVFAARASEGWLPTQLTRYTTDRCKSINLFGWWSATLLHFSVEMRDESNGMNIVDPLHSGEGLYAVSAFPNGSLPVLVSPLPIATAEHGRLLYSRVVTPAPSDAFAFSIAQIEIATLVPSGLAIDANGWTKLLTVLQGTIEEMVWAPDGAMLAFTNVRGDHGFLGVVAFANATTLLSDAIAWVAPSHDTDAGPRWSHDGTRLAWRRERDMVGVDGRDQRCVKGGYCGRTGAAYSLMVASVRKEDEASAVVSVADVRTLFSDFITGWANGEAGYGSRPMDWSADGSELFFPCETSGYVHVAAVAVPPPASAAVKHAVKLQKLPRDLTSLPCDNQAWSLHTSTATGTAQTLYVVHNCDNVDSMGIAAIDVVTGKRTVVIAAAPTRVVGMTTTLGLAHVDAGLIFVETTWSNSTVLRLLPTGAPAGSLGTLLTPSPSSSRFDGSAFVTPSLVTFPSHDGLTVHAQLFEPAASEGGSNSTPRPAVVFTHGGSQRQMYASFHFGECYAQLYALNQHLASLGFVVLSINYRGGPGYGVKWRAANGTGWEGASEYQDVLAGGQWLGARAEVDAARIGIYGLSYGGLNTMQALSRNSDVFAAGVANAPVFNWITQHRFDHISNPFEIARPRGGSGFRNLPIGPRADLAGPEWLDHTQNNIALAWDSSPAGHMEKLTSPLLTIQGDADQEVAFQETAGILAALRARGFEEVESLVFPDESHGLGRFSNQLLAAQATADFFVKILKKKK